MNRLRIPLLCLVLLGLAGCGDPTACTLMGCETGLSVRIPQMHKALPEAARIRVCAETQCSATRDRRAQFIQVRLPDDAGPRDVRVRLQVFGPDGRAIAAAEGTATLTRIAPNGGGECGPVCFVASMRYFPEDNTLISRPLGR